MFDLTGEFKMILNKEVPAPPELESKLLPGETVTVAYTTGAGGTMAVTSKRLVFLNLVGLGKTKNAQFGSIPLNGISGWTYDTGVGKMLQAGTSVLLYTRAGEITLTVSKVIDIDGLESAIAGAILGA